LYFSGLVADIQGVGDLYTDPQVLSDDYRFGDGDLGPRGMALFFRTYRNCGTSDGLGIPTFPLSKNELKVQSKYEDDEITVSDDEEHDDVDDDLSYKEDSASLDRGNDEDDGTAHSSVKSRERLDRFQRLDLNRLRRSRALMYADHPPHPPRHVSLPGSGNNSEGDSAATQVRSNLSSSLAVSRRSQALRSGLSLSSSTSPSPSKALLHHPHRFYRRTRSEIDEVSVCLERAARHREYSMADFHRAPSGELEPRRFKKSSGGCGPLSADAASSANGLPRPTTTSSAFHKSALVRKLSQPMIPNEQCRCNLGKVHYQLAVLHGLNRFPEVAEAAALHATETSTRGAGQQHDHDAAAHGEPCSPAEHDVLSVLFHLSHAASLMNPPACLALARVLSGRPSSVSTLLPSVVPVDFDLAKELLLRATTSPTLLSKSAARQSVSPRLSAACLLLTLLLEERQLNVPHNLANESDTNDQADASGEASKTPGSNEPLLDGFVRRVLEDAIDLYNQYRDEQRQLEVHRHVAMKSSCAAAHQQDSTAGHALASVLRAGDRVEANYALEGTYYPAAVTDISSAPVNDAATMLVTVQYDDDGSSEALPIDQVRIVVPVAATQTRLGGPRREAADGCHDDDEEEEEEEFDDDEELDCELLMQPYELLALLAHAQLQDGESAAAAELYEQAASGAADDGKMQLATAYSLKSSELLLRSGK
jgi:Alpha-kinase family